MKAFAGEGEDVYPSSDGEPMAETPAQREAMIYIISALDAFFAKREDVYVSGDLLIYYEQGDPDVRVAPDAFVAFGVPRGQREKYLLWREGKAPDFVMEVASPSAWKRDRDEKPDIYAGMGVSEYWRYDADGTFFRPRLQGVRRAGGRWRPVEAHLEGGLKLFRSEALGMDLRLDDDGRIRLRTAGEDLLSYAELQARTEELRARVTEQRVEILELRERIKALTAQVPPQVP